MKFMQVFTKAPKHQRFNYTPRFYDPQKEESEERERRIKFELDRQRGEAKKEDIDGYRSRMTGSFHEARKRSAPGAGGSMNATLLRLGILLFITVLLIAFLQYGKPALYGFFLIVPFYLYLKFKRK